MSGGLRALEAVYFCNVLGLMGAGSTVFVVSGGSRAVEVLFRTAKMQAGASGSVWHYENTGCSSRLAKVLVLPKENDQKIWRVLETTPPWRQHKNVRFAKSIINLKEKSYVRTRPEKSSGGEGLRPPPWRCSKHLN